MEFLCTTHKNAKRSFGLYKKRKLWSCVTMNTKYYNRSAFKLNIRNNITRFIIIGIIKCIKTIEL